MFSLSLGENSIDNIQVGGGAWLASPDDWPTTDVTNKPMMPFLTIWPEFFIIPTIAEGMVVTVFLPSELIEGRSTAACLRSISMNEDNDLLVKTKNLPCVCVNRAGERELSMEEAASLPKLFVKKQKFTDEEFKEDNEDDYIGMLNSKLFGRPGWLQENLDLHWHPGKFGFCLQLFESTLRKGDPAYDGLFDDGACYLFLHKGLKRMTDNDSCGVLFVQFT